MDERVYPPPFVSQQELFYNSLAQHKLSLHLRIGDKGLKQLLEYLQNCHTPTSLTSIDLRKNCIKNGGIEALTKFLSLTTDLTNLDLSDNRIGTEGLYSLSSFLVSRKTRKLVDLDLSANKITDTGVLRLLPLFTYYSLTFLDLTGNNIGLNGVKEICVVLQSPHLNLTELSLSCNAIGNKGGEVIGDAIYHFNTRLTALHLYTCCIGKSGCEAICKAMRTNRSLFALSMGGNTVTSVCFEYMRENFHLVELSLGVRTRSKVRDIIRRNLQLWKERATWCCVINWMCRVMVGECDILPLEMMFYILRFVAPSLGEDEIRRVMKFGTDISTLGNERKELLERVYGRGIIWCWRERK